MILLKKHIIVFICICVNYGYEWMQQWDSNPHKLVYGAVGSDD